jgi:hypothetical protein
MYRIKLTIEQWTDLIYHKWPSRPTNLIYPAYWFANFTQWLNNDLGAQVIKDQQGNFSSLEFVDEAKAIDFVLRYA